jgi:hypothetical protein
VDKECRVAKGCIRDEVWMREREEYDARGKRSSDQRWGGLYIQGSNRSPGGDQGIEGGRGAQQAQTAFR